VFGRIGDRNRGEAAPAWRAMDRGVIVAHRRRDVI
jgi:hypothetical protein